MFNDSNSEGVTPPEQVVTSSPTEASNRWQVRYGPALPQAIVGATGLFIGLAGLAAGRTDIETMAILPAIIGVVKVVAGLSGAAAGMGWAWKSHERQLDSNPKPE